MGPGHLAAGFAANTAAPKILLIFLLVASEALDILSFIFIYFGFEDPGVSQTSLYEGIDIIIPASIVWSHSLVMAIIWSITFGAIAYFFWKDRKIGLVFGPVVFSHWAMDLIVHSPDLPLFFGGSPKVGLGLWSSGAGMIASIILEVVLLAVGIALYLFARKRKVSVKSIS